MRYLLILAAALLLAAAATAAAGSWLNAITAAVLSAVIFWLSWLMAPARRERRILRKNPWVEYDTTVVAFPTKALRCTFTLTAGGHDHHYRADPNEDFPLGKQTIWFAGTPGKTVGVVSLRHGGCVSLAYHSNAVPPSPPSPPPAS